MLLNKEKIIAKVLSGNASDAERQKLEIWIGESANNRKEFEQAKAIWETTAKLKTRRVYDADKAWNKFTRDLPTETVTKTKQSKYRLIQAAAALVFICLLAILLKVNYNESVEVVPVLSEAHKLIAQPESIGLITEFEEVDTVFNLAQNEPKTARKHSYKRTWIKHPTLITLSTGDSAKAYLLPDNSIVFLNANSELEYLSDFSGNKRHLKLKGEGYFQVSEDSSSFNVDCENLIVRTNSASFNIKSYQNDKVVEVIVASGNVEFSGIGSMNFKSLNLKEGETGIYKKESNELTKSASVRKNYKWWQKSFRMKIKNFFDKLFGKSTSKGVINQNK